jgi:hypothetical protein
MFDELIKNPIVSVSFLNNVTKCGLVALVIKKYRIKG